MTFNLYVDEHEKCLFFFLRKLLFHVLAKHLSFIGSIHKALLVHVFVVLTIDIATLKVIFVVA